LTVASHFDNKIDEPGDGEFLHVWLACLRHFDIEHGAQRRNQHPMVVFVDLNDRTIKTFVFGIRERGKE
jgi:hypothetical protein